MATRSAAARCRCWPRCCTTGTSRGTSEPGGAGGWRGAQPVTGQLSLAMPCCTEVWRASRVPPGAGPLSSPRRSRCWTLWRSTRRRRWVAQSCNSQRASLSGTGLQLDANWMQRGWARGPRCPSASPSCHCLPPGLHLSPHGRRHRRGPARPPHRRLQRQPPGWAGAGEGPSACGALLLKRRHLRQDLRQPWVATRPLIAARPPASSRSLLLPADHAGGGAGREPDGRQPRAPVRPGWVVGGVQVASAGPGRPAGSGAAWGLGAVLSSVFDMHLAPPCHFAQLPPPLPSLPRLPRLQTGTPPRTCRRGSGRGASARRARSSSTG